MTPPSLSLFVVSGAGESDTAIEVASTLGSVGVALSHRNIIVVRQDELEDRLRAHVQEPDADDRLIGFVVAGDTLEPKALSAVEEAASAAPDAGLIYGDAVEERLGNDAPRHRPAWSPDLLTAQMYFRGVWFARASVIALSLSSHEPQSPLSGLHDLALRIGEEVSSVVSLPTLLATVHLGAADRPDDVDVQALDRHFARSGMPIEATAHPVLPNVAGYQPAGDHGWPLVSIVIPTGGTFRRVRGADVELVTNAVSSVVGSSTYPSYEIVVVIDQNSPDELGERIKALSERVTVIRDTRPFNFAATVNLGVEHASGDVVVLLNDDTEVVSSDWLERLVARTSLDRVGAVGVRLLYGDGRLQHGGVVARHGSADHLYHGYPGDSVGHHDVLAGTCNFLAVTGACMAIRRDHWDAIGGMNEDLPLNYNDVDLCLRLGAHGWVTVFDGTAVLTHLETSSRPQGSETWEHEVVRDEWGDILWDDPFDNPNLRRIGVSQFPRPAALSRLRTGSGHENFGGFEASHGKLPCPVPARNVDRS